MAWTCHQCGWKDKSSQHKYYASKGLARPSCEVCNPSFKQRLPGLWRDLIIGSFSNTYMGYGPLASLPYIPLVMLLPVTVLFWVHGTAAIVLSLLLFIAGWLSNAYIATKVGELIRQRLQRGRSIYGLVLGYYAPLLLVLVAALILALFFI
ncbi:hypothetical protein K0I63_08750 [Shewanella rhizosphaerae]|uniref:hypothetical protein n=1 Tax=Shewanella rhizosphaerae TaxID=2864207 RepID=UPI001C6608CD|nr:hypothetical protein [Shewanella rhizosphaerae]QYK14551.1 hypothetical protein K0I63_08750 [Shewanella rhizosphaerae]